MRISNITFLSLLAIGLISSVASAQNVDFDAKNFPGKEDALKQAKASLSEGDVYFFNGVAFCKYNLEETYCKRSHKYYKQAALAYAAAYAFNPNNALLNFKLGIYYYNSENMYHASPYFSKAYELDPKVDSLILFYMARSQQLDARWDEAIGNYAKFKSAYFKGNNGRRKLAVDGNDIDRFIAECKNGKNATNAFPATVLNLGSGVNSGEFEYNPIPFEDGRILTFTQRSEVVISQDDEEGEVQDTATTDEKILISYRKGDTTWTTRKPLDYQKKTSRKEQLSLLALSADGQNMLVYKDGDIYESYFSENRWSAPELIPGDLNTEAMETSAAYSPDGNTVYFSSSRKGGFGGMDLYQCLLDSTRTCTKSVNLGPVVNSGEDEDGIFLSRDGKALFFASKGHNSMGGFDVFFSLKNDTGAWMPPQNMGLPTNSPNDDIFLVLDKNNKRGFLASYRADSKGNMDIFSCNYDKPIVSTPGDAAQKPVEAKTTTQGEVPGETRDEISTKLIEVAISVLDAVTKQAIRAHVFAELYNHEEVFCADSSARSCTLMLGTDARYKLHVESPGYCSHEFVISIPRDSREMKVETFLVRVPTLQVKSSTGQEVANDSLLANSWLEGQVSDFSSHENVPATIVVREMPGGEVVAQTSTDQHGKYKVKLQHGKQYTIETRAEGYFFQDQNIQVASNASVYNFVCKGMKSESVVVLQSVPDSMKSRITQSNLCLFQGDLGDAHNEYVIRLMPVDSSYSPVTICAHGKFNVAIPTSTAYKVEVHAAGYSYKFSDLLAGLSTQASIVQFLNSFTPVPNSSSELRLNKYIFGTNEFQCNDSVTNTICKCISAVGSNDVEVHVVGHTDNVGGDALNNKLSVKRAQALKESCSKCAAARVNFVVSGAGKSQPTCMANTDECRAANRRAEVTIKSTYK